MKILIKNDIFPNSDFTEHNICVDCIKQKQMKHTIKCATRSTQLLEIIHTKCMFGKLDYKLNSIFYFLVIKVILK